MSVEEARIERGALATDQQRKASNPLKSVWVEASAGTGKTKVLSDRVLRLLLSGVKPSKILCLTYTKAAAVEMNSRIAGRLSKWAIADEEILHKELKTLLGDNLPQDNVEYIKLAAKSRQLFALLLDTPGGMKIQTIHSFCQEILKRFPLEAQISPYFQVMDDRSSAEAIAEIKAKLLQKIEQEPMSLVAQSLAFLTKQVSEYKFPEIMNAIAENRNKIIRLLSNYKDFDKLLKDTAQKLGVNVEDDDENLKLDFWQKLNRVEIKQIMQALVQGAKTDVSRAEILAANLESNNYENYRSVFLTQKNEVKAATKNAVAANPEVLEKIKNEAERILELENKLTAIRLWNSTKAVLYLAEELIAGYNYYKNIHSKMDYEDLIVLTRNLLENQAVAQWVLYKLDGGIDSVLIDEAQDTSPDQWAIVKALTEEFFAGQGIDEVVRTIFAVGDRKQSIYSFQGADPEEFEAMRRHFKNVADNFEEIHLDVSFRSTAAVLEAVNQVFQDEESKAGVVLPEQDITHIPFRIGDAGKVELWNLIEPLENENTDVWLPPVERVIADSTSARLAKDIAARIKKIVDNGELLPSQNRTIKYRDFMVLVQRRNSFVEELVRACKSIGVSIAGVDKIKLLEQIAVQDLLAIGRFLLLPTDDLTLAVILKSPIFGLDDDDLFKLCYNRKNASLWTKLGDDNKYQEIYQNLQKLLNMADFVRPFELYSYILNKLNGREKFVERMGIETEDGIDEFMNLTLNFEQEHIPSLQSFVEWMSKDEVEIKREQEQTEVDAVRIMTVHGSKGLQAPIVILPDTIRVATAKKESGILWDEIMLYPLCAADYEKNCQRINDEQVKKTLEEYRRLLYVALTRAEDRLCVCGYRGKNAAKSESWYEICRKNFAKLAGNELNGELVYETVQETKPQVKEIKEVPKLLLPEVEWLQNPALEEGALAKPYTPSRPDEAETEPGLVSPISLQDANRYRRGQVIHKLLQFLPDVKAMDKTNVINKFLEIHAPEMKGCEKRKITEEVLELINNQQFAAIFGSKSKAEVPIMGLAEGKIISGQIDRLVELENEIWIVDYKTNRPAAEFASDVPLVYQKQMKAYKLLIEKIFPEKAVKMFILWTDTARLMLIE